MEILKRNHKYPHNRGTILAHSTTGFTIHESGTEIGITLEVKHLDQTFHVILTPDETKQLIESLLRKK
jgi:hypothetical protein